jgi:hypothetical protein
MAQFIKHVGKHGDRRVAIVFRVVPDEEHMALVCYPDNLKAEFHDALMRVIESPEGQDATDLADALSRNLLPDGRQILQTFHKEGMIKKVPTSQIVVTPNATSSVRLDELNEIFDGIEAGGEAGEKMKKLDEAAGLVDPKANRQPAPGAQVDAVLGDGLDDASMAANLEQQALQMEADAKGLLAESKRLKAEAKALKPKKKAAKKKAKKSS